jgi:hypothetical protein
LPALPRALFLPGQRHRVAAAVGHHRPNPTQHLLAGQREKKVERETYHIIVKPVSIFVVILVLEVILILREHFVFERLSCEIVDGTRYDLQTSKESEKYVERDEGQTGRTFSLISSPI